MSEERWLPVVGYEGYYEVSDLGRVRSVARITSDGRRTDATRLRQGKILRQDVNDRGYRRVTLSRNSVKRRVTVHSLVLTAFVGPRPEGFDTCHGDGNPNNNALTNLRWDTKSANAADVIAHGHNRWSNRLRCGRGHRLGKPNVPAKTKNDRIRTCLACSLASTYLSRHPHLDRQDVSDWFYDRIIRGDRRRQSYPGPGWRPVSVPA